MTDGMSKRSFAVRLTLALVVLVVSTGIGVRLLLTTLAKPEAPLALPTSAHTTAARSPGPAATSATAAATGSPTPHPTGSPAPPVPTGDPLAPVVGPVAATASSPDPTVLAGLLTAAFDPKALGLRPDGVVIDDLTGEVLYDRLSAVPLVPASTAKLATAVAALEVLGPQAHLTTRVIDRGVGRLVLVGGGDPTLASRPAPGDLPAATLVDLARVTAAAVRRQGRVAVTLTYDGALFSGPAVAPGWKPGYVSDGDVAPVGALMVDGGRASPGGRSRVPDPAGTAALRFAALLTADGVTVTGRPTAATAAAAGAVTGAVAGAVLASVDSPPIVSLVEAMLATSDNDIAEALARHIALARGGPGTFAAGGPAIGDALSRLGVAGVALVDGSGLSVRDRIPPAALALILRLASAVDHPELRPVLTSLPVARFSGTLVRRYADLGTRAAGGFVRAKTGTLNNVNAMAGTVVDRDGRLLVFAFLSNRTKPVLGPKTPPQGLDALIAVVAACGCR